MTTSTSLDREVEPEQPLVEMRDIHFGYGSKEVVTDINCAVSRGEILTLFGPSGCGKSTLLNMVAGLLKPWSGELLFDGKPIEGINREVGYMTQEDTLLPWNTVRQNVALPLKIRSVPASEINERTSRYLELLGLAHAADYFPSQLSGGMKRRTLLARSMIYNPRMLLMDEPFAALDAALREDLHAETRKAVRTLDQTVLFVTHDTSEAVVVSDRVLVFGGKPATIAAELRMPFARDEDVTDILQSKEFAEVQRDVRRALNAAQEPQQVTS